MPLEKKLRYSITYTLFFIRLWPQSNGMASRGRQAEVPNLGPENMEKFGTTQIYQPQKFEVFDPIIDVTC